MTGEKHLMADSGYPQYAILDECTSAVTLEVEQTFYERATGQYTAAQSPTPRSAFC